MKAAGELSRTQAATRQRVLHAAVALATERGYDGFTMRDVAGQADVSPATAYVYYRSKDAVLLDALNERGMQSSAAVVRRVGSPAARVIAAFDKVVRAYEQAPLLYRAMFRAYIGQDTSATAADESPWSGRSWIAVALPDDLPDRQVLVEIAQSEVLTAMISLVTGTPPADVVARFQRAISHILA